MRLQVGGLLLLFAFQLNMANMEHEERVWNLDGAPVFDTGSEI